jgi:hypothetical protein
MNLHQLENNPQNIGVKTMSLFQEINAKEVHSINGGKLLPQVIKFPFTIKFPIRRPRCPIYFF